MKVQLIDSVQNVIDSIISLENYKTPPEVEVVQGSQDGDGYASKTYAITIKSKNGKSFNLFVKYLPEDVRSDWKDIFRSMFYCEFRFYNEIFPIFDKFQKMKNIKEPFDNIPKHFKVNIENYEDPIVVLENLRSLGYTLRDRKKPIDDAHLRLPIKAFARYHAISFAMKDHEFEKFKPLTEGMGDFFSEHMGTFGMDAAVNKAMEQLLETLDPSLEKRLVDCCKTLPDKLTKIVRDCPKYVDEYAVITQGDCWSNNMMFLYDNKTGNPIEVKLIDWQCQRYNSPVLDFSYFFYSLATKKELENAEIYLNLYYETLSERIRELGSDPNKLYPYEIFMEHWRKFSLFGLCMAICVVKALLFEEDEVPQLLNSNESVDSFMGVVKNQDKYNERIKDLVLYFIDKGLI